MVMCEIVQKILSMSLTAAVVIMVVLLVRLLLKRAPKVFSYLLWAVVLFRLLCPVSLSSDFSLFRFLNVTETEIINAEVVAESSGYEGNSGLMLPMMQAEAMGGDSLLGRQQEIATDHTEMIRTLLFAYVWLFGVVVMLLYSVIRLLILKRRLVGALYLKENIYLVDYVDTPFVLGIFSPKIYLPSNLEKKEYAYVILHEKQHIRRGDHVIRIVSCLALCIHWFNPLVWLAYILAGRDMEMSCDEAVMKRMEGDIRAEYAISLLKFASGRKLRPGTPLAFGEGDTKGRVKNIMKYQKPKYWIIAAAVLICLLAGVILLTNPREKVNESENAENVTNGEESLYEETSQVAKEQEESVSHNTEVQPEVESPMATTLTEPPQLLLQDTLSSTLNGFVVTADTYSWHYPANEEEMVVTEASGNFPTIAAKLAGQEGWIKLVDYNGIDYAPYLAGFEMTPDRIVVKEYDLLELGNMEPRLLAETEYEEVYLLELVPRRIYELKAEWDEEKLAKNGFFGEAYYIFSTSDVTESADEEVATSAEDNAKKEQPQSLSVGELFAEPVNNLENVSLLMEKYSSHSGDLEIVNHSDTALIYGEWFDIQVKIEKEWYSLSYLIENLAFYAIGYNAPPGETTIKKVDWTIMYGELPVGTYRIVTDVLKTTDVQEPGSYEKYYIAAEFEIKQ